ncbi:Nif11-like leader peptide family natural product precursor [Nostoc sp. UCD121]|uniref:Nif11-like leader peptide family natural product precursor n=1 Tax=unclassified Nostoc TaxID=2593658 RepID=UPI001623B4F8|nr:MULTISPECIES: Nif11-like leader peptide family natural product precursor [unclassified Nostoc]MBC1223654.1 Nif11-like leader peptide family natural product precursor [Nostoc sp. UCD120]MBC1279599.1 Nif11-like leader peptide family natural product precursor [Nostoc sp. UCD121]MBC1296621.1 Nif11-like leader peptide family natural product precursor [Nostoc sp. UCD122]
MSIESAKAFYQRVTTDENFRTQVESSPIEERGTFLQAAGYSFTQREWEAASAEILETTSIDGELNEAQLEAIAGGRTPMALYGISADL